MRQIVLDTETTGLQYAQGHRIIEIGCVELIDRKFTGKRYHQYINPDREIDEQAVAIHGITNHFLRDKPRFAEVAETFLEFVIDAELIIHNAPFDIGFINYEFNLYSKKIKSISQSCRVLDTLVLAKKIHTGQRNSLDALCKRYSVDNSQREYHGALLDAHLLAQVYLSMTGGQSSLFTELEESERAQNRDSSIVPMQRSSSTNLCVITANPLELLNHNEQLKKMAEVGPCLWLEEVN